MFLVVAYLAFVSVLYRNVALSIMTLLAGSFVPLLSGGESNFVTLFGYLFVLALGTFAVAWKMGQRTLLIVLLGILFFYSVPYTIGFADFDMPTAFLFALAFAASFFLVNFLAMRKSGDVDEQDLFISGLHSVSLLMWIRVAVEHDWRSFIALLIALALGIAAYAIALGGQTARRFAQTRFASALLFLVAATVFEFSGSALTIAFIVEISLLVLLALKVLRDVQSARQLSVLFAVPAVMSLRNMAEYLSATSVFTQDFFVIVLMMAALASTGLMLKRASSDQHSGVSESDDISLEGVLLTIASLYALLLVWDVLHIAIASQSIATSMALVVYTVTGIALYVRGKMSDNKRSVHIGSALFALVIIRLIFVEIWSMSVWYRIITFFIIGALLMSTAFLGKEKKEKIILS